MFTRRINPAATIFISWLLISLKCTAINAQISFGGSKSTPSTCGNGILDSGEQCDSSATGFSSECCTSACRLNPSYFTTCHVGAGVCINGDCKTRSQQCSAFDDNILSVSSSLALEGPFSVCSVVSATSVGLDSRKSPVVLTQSKSCTLSCLGQNMINGSSICLDLRFYGNVQSLVQDGSTCFSNAPGSSGWGVCQSGHCQQALCKKYRCSNNGDCDASSLSLKCNCKPGYSGSDCSIAATCDGRIDSCGVCNGDHSSCVSPLSDPARDHNGNGNDQASSGLAGFLASQNFKTIYLPVAASVVGLMLLMAVISLVYRRRSHLGKRTDSHGNISVGAFNTNLSPSDGDLRSHRFSTSAASLAQFRKSQGISGGGNVSTPIPNASSQPSTLIQSPSLKTLRTGVAGVSVRFDEFRCIHNYQKQMPDEVEIEVGDVLFKLFEYDDGWAKGYNTRTGLEGMYPVGFTERVL